LGGGARVRHPPVQRFRLLVSLGSFARLKGREAGAWEPIEAAAPKGLWGPPQGDQEGRGERSPPPRPARKPTAGRGDAPPPPPPQPTRGFSGRGGEG